MKHADSIKRFRAIVLSWTVLASALLSGCSGGGETDAPASTGAALYGQHCQACHGGATGGAVLANAPRHDGAGHTWHHPDQYLEAIILNGGPQAMPAFRGRLREEEVREVIAHIKTWWTPEQRSYQAGLTAQARGAGG
jgi:mono/diheme cytochrome c family protein